MSTNTTTTTTNSLKQKRKTKNWSQQKLAELTNLSRAEISAIETNRITPSTAVALTLAKAFSCSVEDIFKLPAKQQNDSPTLWAWKLENPTASTYTRLHRATINNQTIIYPAQTTLAGTITHDGYQQNNKTHWTTTKNNNPDNLIVIAGCDPAVALLANECACYHSEDNNLRLLPITRTSKQALQMLTEGLVHMAGIHLTNNQTHIQKYLGPSYRLLRITKWEEGLALNPKLKYHSIKSAIKNINKKYWVARELGSGARKCMDNLFLDENNKSQTKSDKFKIANDHHTVAEAIRSGWAMAGICVKLPAAEAGLKFISVQTENYDLCYHKNFEKDPRFKQIKKIIRSKNYKQKLGELPGYNTTETGITIN